MTGDGLGPDARALLDAARGGDDPSAADRDRVRARVAAAIGAAAVTGSAGSAGGAAAGAAGAGAGATGAGLALKLVLAILAAGAIATGGYLALRGSGDGRTPASEPVAVTEPDTAAAPAPAAEPDPIEIDPDPIEVDPEPVVIDDPARRKPRPTPPKPAAADSLAAEHALLARANAALRAGDPAAALAALDEHAREFPRGVLVEERSAARVVALCAAGRTDAGARARDAFLDRWPRSVHAARVRGACP